MIEHVDHRDQIEMLGWIIGLLEKARRDVRAWKSDRGNPARNRIRLDPVELDEAGRLGRLEQKTHVTANIENALTPGQIRRGQLII
jgi:hypothetical protein